MHVGQKTTFATSYTLAGNPVTVTGAVLAVTVDNTNVVDASVDADGVTIDVVAKALGTATLTVTSTLPDSTVLTATAQIVVDALADTLVLTQGPVV